MSELNSFIPCLGYLVIGISLLGLFREGINAFEFGFPLVFFLCSLGVHLPFDLDINPE